MSFGHLATTTQILSLEMYMTLNIQDLHASMEGFVETVTILMLLDHTMAQPPIV